MSDGNGACTFCNGLKCVVCSDELASWEERARGITRVTQYTEEELKEISVKAFLKAIEDNNRALIQPKKDKDGKE